MTDGGQTTHYGLNKIAGTDLVDINTDFNTNWDIIDGVLWLIAQSGGTGVVSPSVSLSWSSGSTTTLSNEVGTTIGGTGANAITLVATVTHGTNAITSLTFSRSNATLPATDFSSNPRVVSNPTDGSYTYKDIIPITVDTIYTATVTDGTLTGTATVHFTFFANPPVINAFTTSIAPANPYEKTQVTMEPTLTFRVTKGTYDITDVHILKNGVLIDGIVTAGPYTSNTGSGALGNLPNGGTLVFKDGPTGTSPPGAGLDDTAVYTGIVKDANPTPVTVTSSPITYTFLYPVYYGVGAAGLNAAGIIALGSQTNALGSPACKTLSATVTRGTAPAYYTYTGNNQKMYLAYPTSYGAMHNCVDHTTNIDYLTSGLITLRGSTVVIDGVNYNVYESVNVITGTLILDWS